MSVCVSVLRTLIVSFFIFQLVRNDVVIYYIKGIINQFYFKIVIFITKDFLEPCCSFNFLLLKWDNFHFHFLVIFAQKEIEISPMRGLKIQRTRRWKRKLTWRPREENWPNQIDNNIRWDIKQFPFMKRNILSYFELIRLNILFIKWLNKLELISFT